jgi:hypothetical protein
LTFALRSGTCLMVDLGFSAGLKQAFDQWHGLVEGNPKLAEQAYFWEAPSP